MPILPIPHDAPLHQLPHARDLIPHLRYLFHRNPTPHPSSPTSEPPATSISSLFRRQVVLTPIPTVYQGLNSGPAPGTVIGIVLGSVAGFLLLVWLFWTLSQRGGVGGNTIVAEEDYIVRRRSRSPRSRPRSSRRSEMRQRSRSPQRIIVENRNIVEDRRQSAPPPAPSSSAPPPVVERERIVVEERTERRVDGDDIVEVIEEGSSLSPPKRKSSRRDRSSGQYRTVDPGAYAGGDYPPRNVYGSNSRRYRT